MQVIQRGELDRDASLALTQIHPDTSLETIGQPGREIGKVWGDNRPSSGRSAGSGIRRLHAERHRLFQAPDRQAFGDHPGSQPFLRGRI